MPGSAAFQKQCRRCNARSDRRREGFEQEEVVKLAELGGRSRNERIESCQQTIRSFAAMINQQDTFTAGHAMLAGIPI